MKKKKVIGIIGEQAGGKGAVANIIIKRFGGTRLTVSNVLRRTLDSLYLESTRNNLTSLALVLKDGFGEDVLMKAMLKEVEKEDSDLTIVDGIRMPGDRKPYMDAYADDFKLIYVTADQKIRYERSKSRGEKAGESKASFKEFQKNESARTEQSIPEVGAKADFKIINNGNVEELEVEVLKVMENI